MSELEISDAAYEAAERVSKNYVADVDALDAASDAINAAAPIIVAAELRRLAHTYERRADAVLLHRDGDGTERRKAFLDAADIARRQADELDPQGGTRWERDGYGKR